MGNVITICPGNCRSDGHRDRLRSENEIIDFPAALSAAGWSFALTLADPASNSSIAIITGVAKLANHTFFLVIVLFPL
jgi:hypothetical protein